jgi:hypothetical protein
VTVVTVEFAEEIFAGGRVRRADRRPRPPPESTVGVTGATALHGTATGPESPSCTDLYEKVAAASIAARGCEPSSVPAGRRHAASDVVGQLEQHADQRDSGSEAGSEGSAEDGDEELNGHSSSNRRSADHMPTAGNGPRRTTGRPTWEPAQPQRRGIRAYESSSW